MDEKIMDDTKLALKKLREEISKNKASLKLSCENPLRAAIELDGLFELVDPNERIIRIANKLKELGVKEMEYELLIEKERVRKVVSEFEELHPPVYESCPICLEDINFNASAETQSFVSCCGNWTCKPCADSSMCVGKVRSCPLCREDIPDNPGLYNKRLLKCAERGIKWAQFQVAFKYENGQLGGRANMKKALKLYTLSAEQGHPPALLHLGRLHRAGVPGLVKKSAAKAKEYELQAADLGNFHAMTNVAAMCFQGRLHHGVEEDFPTVTKYSTLASFYSTDDSADKANTILGSMFLYGQDEDGLGKKSYNLATHYLGIAVKSDPAAFNGLAALNFSSALVGQAEYLYAGMHLNGRNILPRAAYWLRKSIAADHEGAKKVLKNIESMEVGKCSACGEKEESSNKKFLRCGRCKIYWYCSKECQIASWNVGHKLDCKSTFC